MVGRNGSALIFENLKITHTHMLYFNIYIYICEI